MWNAQQRGLVTTSLIAINVAIAIYTFSKSSTTGGRIGPVHRDFALDAFDLRENGEWYRLVTSGFLHYGLIHLLFNMWALYNLGGVIERELGRGRFAALYFASLLAGSAGALLVTPNALTAGASGAIFGLFGAMAAGMHRRGINIFKTGLGPILILNIIFTFTWGGVSIGGHMGGLIGGAVVGWFGFHQPRIARTARRAMAMGYASAGAVAALAVIVAAIAAQRA